MGTLYYLNPLPKRIDKEQFPTFWKFPFESFVVLSTLFLVRKLKQRYLSDFDIKTIFMIFRPISILVDDETHYGFTIDTKSREKSTLRIRTVNLTQMERLGATPSAILEERGTLNWTIEVKEIIFPKILSKINLVEAFSKYSLLEIEADTLNIPILDVYLTYSDLVKAYELWKETKEYYINSFIILSSDICLLNWLQENITNPASASTAFNLKNFVNCILKELERHIVDKSSTNAPSGPEIQYKKVLEELFPKFANMLPEKAVFPQEENRLIETLQKITMSSQKSTYLEGIRELYNNLSYTLDILLDDFLTAHQVLHMYKIERSLSDVINQVMIPFIVYVVKSKSSERQYIVTPLDIKVNVNNEKKQLYELEENSFFEPFRKELSLEIDENIIEDYSQHNILESYDALSDIFKVLYSKELQNFIKDANEFERMKKIFVSFGRDVL